MTHPKLTLRSTRVANVLGTVCIIIALAISAFMLATSHRGVFP